MYKIHPVHLHFSRVLFHVFTLVSYTVVYLEAIASTSVSATHPASSELSKSTNPIDTNINILSITDYKISSGIPRNSTLNTEEISVYSHFKLRDALHQFIGKAGDVMAKLKELPEPSASTTAIVAPEYCELVSSEVCLWLKDWVEVQGGGLEDGLRVSELCVQKCPLSADCWHNLAVCAESIINTEVTMKQRAEYAMKKSAILSPNDYSAGYAMFLNRQSRYEEVKQLISTVLAPQLLSFFNLNMSNFEHFSNAFTFEKVDCKRPDGIEEKDYSDEILRNEYRNTLRNAVEWSFAHCKSSQQQKGNKEGTTRECKDAFYLLSRVISSPFFETISIARLKVNAKFHQAQLALILGDYETAWTLYSDANQWKLENELDTLYHGKAKRKDKQFEMYLTAQVTTLREKANVWHTLPRVRHETLTYIHPLLHRPIIPLFILGLPRTGSSLIESILSQAHNDTVFAAGEMTFFDTLCAPEAMCSSDTSRCIFPMSLPSSNSPNTIAVPIRSFQLEDESSHKALSRQFSLPYMTRRALLYLEAMGDNAVHAGVRPAVEKGEDPLSHDRLLRGKPLYVIDKLPMNWRHIPTIKLMFPHAPIVRTMRSLLDTAISIFFTDFLPPGLRWSHDLQLIHDRFQLYMDTMQEYRRVPGVADWHEIHYEDIIQNPDTTLESLFSYLGLEWKTEYATSFSKSTRKTFTASSQQVKQPLYSSSVQRWKRFRKMLKLSPLAAWLPLEDHD